MTKRVWNSGPPPHVGWWNASMNRNARAWRWWDGYHWSFWVECCDPIPEVVRRASRQIPTYGYEDIKWTHYWPENARVPRINPETGEKTGG